MLYTINLEDRLVLLCKFLLHGLPLLPQGRHSGHALLPCALDFLWKHGLHEVPVVLLCRCGVSLSTRGVRLSRLLVHTQVVHELQEFLLTLLRWAFPCESATCASDPVLALLEAGRRRTRRRTLRCRTLRDNTILRQEALLGRRLILCRRTLLFAAALRCRWEKQPRSHCTRGEVQICRERKTLKQPAHPEPQCCITYGSELLESDIPQTSSGIQVHYVLPLLPFCIPAASLWLQCTARPCADARR